VQIAANEKLKQEDAQRPPAVSGMQPASQRKYGRPLTPALIVLQQPARFSPARWLLDWDIVGPPGGESMIHPSFSVRRTCW
jgi:hypothetical protein